MNNKKSVSRRKFIQKSSALTAGALIGTNTVIGAPAIIKNLFKPNSLINGVQLGVITYSFRSMPDQSAEATLKYILESGMSAVELMGGPAESYAGMPDSKVNMREAWPLMRKQRNGEELTEDEKKELADMRAQMDDHRKLVANWRESVSMKKFEQFGKKYKAAGVSIYGFKPRAFGKDNTDAEIDYGFRAAKALGASHVTLEHPSDDAHTLKLGKMAAKHKVKVAYHGHEQQTPTFWDTALSQSPYNAMNPDMGHYIAAGNTKPLDLLKKYNKNISSMHLKDRQTPENGKDNLIWGSGDTPIPQILGLLKEEKYTFPATVELEYDIPDDSNAVAEVARCLEFCKNALK